LLLPPLLFLVLLGVTAPGDFASKGDAILGVTGVAGEVRLVPDSDRSNRGVTALIMSGDDFGLATLGANMSMDLNFSDLIRSFMLICSAIFSIRIRSISFFFSLSFALSFWGRFDELVLAVIYA
jgi:hypothetical protein